MVTKTSIAEHIPKIFGTKESCGKAGSVAAEGGKEDIVTLGDRQAAHVKNKRLESAKVVR